LREAFETHVPQVEAFLASRFDDGELADLRAYLGRLVEGRRRRRLRASRGPVEL